MKTNRLTVLFKQARTNRNLSLRFFAQKLKVDPAHLCRIEKGIKLPSEQLLARLLLITNCSLRELLNERALA
ncbi:MAG: helix-turn-helix domain-containing protein [Flavobacteriales bacterium]